MSGPPPEEIVDPAMLKALAHPLRRRILDLLRRGPASATTLAAELGENTGATSYHLRELAKHGFIDEAKDLGKGKERWWRARRRDLRFPRRSQQSDEMRALFDDINRHKFADDLELWSRFLERGEELGEWADAVPFSRGALRLTQDELEAFFEDYLALLKRYWRADHEAPPGSRRMLMRFIAFPDPDAD
jgi:DNA-binding transcriptional ArsR family regulator